jgi:hypothetical protein
MANKCMKRYSVSLEIREMEIEMTLRVHFTPVTMPIINKTNSKCCGGCEGMVGNLNSHYVNLN